MHIENIEKGEACSDIVIHPFPQSPYPFFKWMRSPFVPRNASIVDNLWITIALWRKAFKIADEGRAADFYSRRPLFSLTTIEMHARLKRLAKSGIKPL